MERKLQNCTLFINLGNHHLQRNSIKDIASQRDKARTKVENIFFRIMTVASFGKIVESIRKPTNFELIDKTDTQKIFIRQSKLTYIEKTVKNEKINVY